MAKYSLEFKLKVVNEYINGLGGTTYLSDKYNIPAHSVIQDWIDQFKQDGIEGLKREISKTKYSGEFKLHVLQYRQINRLTFKETAYHFGIRNYSNIANWQRIYNEEGFAGLNRTIGRAKDMSKEKEIKELKKINESELEELKRLREENEYLRMSLEYQKKLNALVLKRERKMKKKVK